ncbi:MAG: winged helix-turn-helix transcriptional regulator [Pseudomonadales bacterium]|nr:winged helix-turn-helix transcriptional regulator [Gammaproteobacteria bacterium]MBP6051028.1 winged helix-turn-helix transcriptional regulator [Pseudomonadales bacterium]MBK6582535.1 winged helix-turn-helix transcriptional regulator [Gammaproteobacteria bacterium]MBK7169680.1 winged helix-turn-helix transcriptional regulator [Gammaproteobacteria bacterium]MBK8306885.1 winged helix-turn-helix transcriptional regulator [Gammaproteobacteria bacterium]
MIDLGDHEARHIAALYRHMLKHLDRELAPHGLGPGRYAYLFALYIEDGRTQQALADTVGADKAGAARALARLETDGYIRRVADPRDRRVVRAFLRPRGRRQRMVLEQAALDTIDRLTAHLDDTERRDLKRLLARVATPLLKRLSNDRRARTHGAR